MRRCSAFFRRSMARCCWSRYPAYLISVSTDLSSLRISEGSLTAEDTGDTEELLSKNLGTRTCRAGRPRLAVRAKLDSDLLRHRRRHLRPFQRLLHFLQSPLLRLELRPRFIRDQSHPPSVRSQPPVGVVDPQMQTE